MTWPAQTGRLRRIARLCAAHIEQGGTSTNA
jgi:hypothetical protein